MERQRSARSVSRPAWDRLTGAEFDGEVLAVFRRACILKVTPCSTVDESEGSALALVLPEIGDGPLNIVLDAQVNVMAGFQRGQAACFHHNSLRIGGVCVPFERASIWEPRPDWDELRSRNEAMTRTLEMVLSLARHDAPSTSIMAMLDPAICVGVLQLSVREFFAAARRGMKALEVGWKGEISALRTGVSRLAGLGPGLTPAGDDFLAGVMLCLWLRHPEPLVACRSILQVAVPRTTLFSAAMLQRAAVGECSADWHRLLYAIASGDREGIGVATRPVLAHGNTSGGDTLAGFLWMSRPQHKMQSARSRP